MAAFFVPIFGGHLPDFWEHDAPMVLRRSSVRVLTSAFMSAVVPGGVRRVVLLDSSRVFSNLGSVQEVEG